MWCCRPIVLAWLAALAAALILHVILREAGMSWIGGHVISVSMIVLYGRYLCCGAKNDVSMVQGVATGQQQEGQIQQRQKQLRTNKLMGQENRQDEPATKIDRDGHVAGADYLILDKYKDENASIPGDRKDLRKQNCADTQACKEEQRNHQHPQRNQRVHFLDNVKIFLTALVLAHHVVAAFGGAGGSWFLVVGNYDCYFQVAAGCFIVLNQSFFMPLFFFISAFFIPRSYDRSGHDNFMKDKAKRLLLPAVCTSVTIVPLTSIVAQATVGCDSLVYDPSPGHCWFLFWLLLFCWAYTTFEKADRSSPAPPPGYEPLAAKPAAVTCATDVSAEPASCSGATGDGVAPAEPVSDVGTFPNHSDLPSTITRMCFGGVLICGFLMYAIFMVVNNPMFFSMPIAMGSLVSDVLMFSTGIVAVKQRWISPTSLIVDHLDIPVSRLRLFTVVEGVVLVLVAILARSNEALWLFLFPVAGLFCVDMCLAVLQFFQQHFDTEPSSWRKYLADASYGVYLIHPPVVVAATRAFALTYNAVYGKNEDVQDVIAFEHGPSVVSSSRLLGPGDGSLHLFVGCMIVMVVSFVVCWPLAGWLRRLPMLREVL